MPLNILAGLSHDEPIYDGDFADPTALAAGSTLYFYASSSQPSRYDHGANLPVIALSRGDGFSGRFVGDAMPKVPTWSVSGYQWGPDVWARPDGTYVMYYSTPATVPLGCLATPPASGCVKTVRGWTNAECISRATATGPTGPFVDNSTSAFICPTSEGGAIDPSVFVASDGTPWLLWKSDGDCCDEPTSIYSQQLSPDGLSTVGPPHRLLGATQPWEDDLVEAPAMIQDHDHFWLFYSGSLWGHKTYGIGIARCASVVGPCTKPLDHAWVASHADGVSDQGPGGEEFYQTGSIVWMVHHGLAPGQAGNSAQRRLYVDLIAFPPGELPHLAAREPAAALAAAEVYYGDPSLPKDPRAAYLKVLHLAGVSATANDAALISSAANGLHGPGEQEALRPDRRRARSAEPHRLRGLPRHHPGCPIPVSVPHRRSHPSDDRRTEPVALDILNRCRSGRREVDFCEIPESPIGFQSVPLIPTRCRRIGRPPFDQDGARPCGNWRGQVTFRRSVS